jgi:hypothetical protein
VLSEETELCALSRPVYSFQRNKKASFHFVSSLLRSLLSVALQKLLWLPWTTDYGPRTTDKTGIVPFVVTREQGAFLRVIDLLDYT